MEVYIVGILIAVFCFSNGYSQLCPNSQNSVNSNLDYGYCYCDLTVGVCDVNCGCCDPDCNASYTKIFDSCSFYNSSGLTSPQLCNVSSSLFCILIDYYPDRNYYVNQLPICNYSGIDSLISTYSSRQPYSPSPSPLPVFTLDSNRYRKSDPVYVSYTTSTFTGIDFLRLPAPGLAGSQSNCIDRSPVEFLVERSGECLRSFNSLYSACNNPNNFTNIQVSQVSDSFNAPFLDARSFCGGSNWPFTIINSPSCVKGGSCSSGNGIQPNVTVISIQPNGQQTIGTCSSFLLTWNANTCNNVVLVRVFGFGVEYRLVYTLGTSAFTSASTITITVGALAQSKLQGIPTRLLQRFSVRFVPAEVDANPLVNRVRSGNSGYLLGQPLLAGRLASDSNSSNLQYIQMSSSKSQQLNVLQSSGAYGGDCLACLLGAGTGSANLTGLSSAVSSASTGCFRPVAFGVQYRSGCTLTVNATSLQTYCALYSDVLKTLLWNSDSAQVPTHVAAFGNASSDEPGNWVPLLNSSSTSSLASWDSNSMVCKNMVVGLDLQFLYTATNSVANPQYKVIGAMYTLVQQDVYFRCVTPYCVSSTNTTNSLTQQVEARVSVAFLDARTNATSRSKQTPTSVGQLPADFFAPFFYDATSGAAPSARRTASASLFALPARLLSVLLSALSAPLSHLLHYTNYCLHLLGVPLFSQMPAIDSISSETLLQRIAHATASASPSLVVYLSALFGLLVPLIARAILSA